MKEIIIRLCLWIIGLCGVRSRDEMNDVYKFLKRMGHLRNNHPVHLTRRKLTERASFLQEELDEFKTAIATQDLSEQADALIDLVYVAYGTAIMLGLPWDEMWDEVQRANISKIPGVGKRGNAADAIKPAGWIPPRHAMILERFGYSRDEWFENDNFIEERAHDDAAYLTR